MINANELRLRNRLQDAMGLEVDLIVYKIEEGIITCGDANFSYPYLAEQLNGIPLTNAILENSSFSQAGRMWNDYERDIHIVREMDHYLMKTSPDETMGTPIQFVHDLQNRYFSITGVELNINL